ncbi:MAG: H-NS histone family protein [Oceanicaulis sp.]|nr:H-NS histone family protein [Oceanicaulis sp.]
MTDAFETLTEMSERELTDLELAIQKERKSRAKRKQQEAARELIAIARKHNLPLDEIVQAAKSKTTKGKPRFQHPEKPTLTWTGQGRKPKWVVEHIKQGGELEDLRIKE